MTSRQTEEDRKNFMRDLVMTCMADDYENLEIIMRDVTNWGEGRHVFPTRAEVVSAIEKVIADGYAQSFLLSPRPLHSTAVAFDLERVDDLYFYLTPVGKKIVKNVDELGVGV
jgi:hypothetical protein